MKHLILFLISLTFFSCGNEKKTEQTDFSEVSWDSITSQAKGKDLTMMMWMGDSKINAYMKDVIAKKVKAEHNINLELINGQGARL